jgi:hypothetical protein
MFAEDTHDLVLQQSGLHLASSFVELLHIEVLVALIVPTALAVIRVVAPAAELGIRPIKPEFDYTLLPKT